MVQCRFLNKTSSGMQHHRSLHTEHAEQTEQTEQTECGAASLFSTPIRPRNVVSDYRPRKVLARWGFPVPDWLQSGEGLDHRLLTRHRLPLVLEMCVWGLSHQKIRLYAVSGKN